MNFRLPKETRVQKGFKKRYAFFVNQGGFQAFVLSAYAILGSAFVNIQPEFQWTLAFLSPILREVLTWITLHNASKVTGKEGKGKDSVVLPISHYMATLYAVNLAIIVGGVANAVTSYCILAIDFIEQMYHGLKIVWMYKKRNQNVEGISCSLACLKYTTKVSEVFYTLSEDVKNLVIGEKCSLLSLTYMIIILMAYHGPNAELLGNIKLSIWQFQNPIADIDAYTTNVAILLVVDCISMVINGIFVGFFCQINMFKVMKQLQEKYWHVFATAEAFILIGVKSLLS